MPLDDEYFEWLYSHVGSVELKNRTKTYWKLLKLFYTKEFTWDEENIPRDENRAEDGKALRLEFVNERKIRKTANVKSWMQEPCSVLEMMIALAWKMEFDGGRTQAEWFWEMIANLGLIDCTDAAKSEDIVVNIVLDKLINRQYGESGAGGLFPLHEYDTDQREVELYYQLESYLLERAPI
jgi:hypothetical protein